MHDTPTPMNQMKRQMMQRQRATNACFLAGANRKKIPVI